MADLSTINASGNSSISNAASNGQNAINGFDPTAISANNNTAQQGLYGPNGSQTKQMSDYMNMYKNSILANPTATDLYTTANTKFNVPALQNTSNALNNAVLTDPQQNVDNAKGFNYDSNQIGAKTAMDLGRLSPLAIAAQNNANTAQGNASNYVAAGLSQNATNLLPVQAFGTQLGSQFGEQATGLDQNQTNQMNALVSKLQAGEQLSAAELAAFEQLSAAEEGAQATENAATTGANASMQNARTQFSNLILPTGSTYLNPLNGSAYNPFATPARP